MEPDQSQALEWPRKRELKRLKKEKQEPAWKLEEDLSKDQELEPSREPNMRKVGVVHQPGQQRDQRQDQQCGLAEWDSGKLHMAVEPSNDLAQKKQLQHRWSNPKSQHWNRTGSSLGSQD
ncbi:hypothetical protein AOLI_G00234440 [Acnodon oligacanthus]